MEKQTIAPQTQEKAERTSRNCEEETFAQELPDDAPTARAERKTHGDFF